MYSRECILMYAHYTHEHTLHTLTRTKDEAAVQAGK